MDRFVWWLQNEAELEPTIENLSPTAVRTFLTYVREPNPKGRFGQVRANTTERAKPLTVFAYFREIRAFTNFCLAEGLMDESPLANVKPPRATQEQVQPLSQEQLQGLLNVAVQTPCPERARAVVLSLVDTGLRVSELCSLTIGDLTSQTGEITVTGKGNKKRTIYLGTSARRALRFYINKCRRGAEEHEPLFVSGGGHTPGAGLTPQGVRFILKELAELAEVEGVRCSPHTLRHTFAINFLRGGGNLFELQQLMGHADIAILRRYVKLADADLAKAHRNASPADRMKLR
jgi:integrase/recombinase XerC/integrase/recombinase XerD